MRVCISILIDARMYQHPVFHYTHMFTHAYTHTQTHARMRTHARTHAHTRARTHTHTHTQAPAAVVEKAEAELADKREQLKTVTESIESILGQMPAADATGMCVCFAICPMP
jgi:C4-dicarboxylate-specific signal transduction histidine kinase